MSDAALVGAVTPCWNCGQPMRAGAETCLWCGAALTQAAGDAVASQAGSVVSTPAAPGASQVVTLARPAAVPGLIVDVPVPQRAVGHLPGAFAGSLAGVGRQFTAWLIDVVAAVGAGAAAWIVSGSLLIGVVVVVEVAVVNWVAESRTGLTLGNLAMRIRSAQSDRPFSPGAARTTLQRLLIVGGSIIGVGIGAIIVVASGFTDATGQHRSWADRAAGMRRVVVPPRSAAPRTDEVDLAGVAAPVMVGPVAEVSDDLELSDGQQVPTITPAVAAPIAGPVAPLAMDEPAAPVIEEEIAPLSGVVSPNHEASSGIESTIVTMLPAGVSMLLLVFDTGQREQVATPATINLGRNPTTTQAGDMTIIVKDPESTVSKNHVRIEHSRGQTWVVDLGSTNGTKIIADDGTVTTFRKNERGELEEGARVRIGNRTFTVSLVLGGDS